MFSGGCSLLPLLLQTDFHPERFASFRPILYQRLKVNFLTLHPSPGFHRKTKNSILAPIYKCKSPGNQQGYGEGLDKGFSISYICKRENTENTKHNGLQENRACRRLQVE